MTIAKITCEVFYIKGERVTIIPSGFGTHKLAVVENPTYDVDAFYIVEDAYLEMKKKAEKGGGNSE